MWTDVGRFVSGLLRCLVPRSYHRRAVTLTTFPIASPTQNQAAAEESHEGCPRILSAFDVGLGSCRIVPVVAWRRLCVLTRVVAHIAKPPWGDELHS